jgi:hypothetical protein
MNYHRPLIYDISVPKNNVGTGIIQLKITEHFAVLKLVVLEDHQVM